jgi:hypothetical protein
VSLLACAALEGEERLRVERHLEACAFCREEHAALQGVLDLARSDPARRAAPPLPAAILAARVRARLAAADVAPASRLRWLRPAGMLAAAAAVVWLALPHVVRAPAPAPSREVRVPNEMLARMERTQVREQTARYLNEAGAVLVTVAGQGNDCAHDSERIDVAEESTRSRELLRRRELLVDLEAAEVATARPVLEDVEQILLEVAGLEACARSGDLERIGDHIARRRLLMKIDLMARELQG